ncbi:hypothetical protein FCV25MIE_07669, partial [Fagus crenata]
MAALSLSLRHSRTPARASSALTTRTEPPPLTPPLPATTEQVSLCILFSRHSNRATAFDAATSSHHRA